VGSGCQPASVVWTRSLQRAIFYTDKDGGVRPGSHSITLFDTPVKASLSGFLYRTAHIAGLKAQDQYREDNVRTPYPPEQGQVGNNVHETPCTGGIGVDVSSYLQYSGIQRESVCGQGTASTNWKP
jgi:hypothetical protein